MMTIVIIDGRNIAYTCNSPQVIDRIADWIFSYLTNTSETIRNDSKLLLVFDTHVRGKHANRPGNEPEFQ